MNTRGCTDALTCDTCHTAWALQCVGCHVTYDLRLDQVDYQTGTITPGLTQGSRSRFSLIDVLLATGPDGRVQGVKVKSTGKDYFSIGVHITKEHARKLEDERIKAKNIQQDDL